MDLFSLKDLFSLMKEVFYTNLLFILLFIFFLCLVGIIIGIIVSITMKSAKIILKHQNTNVIKKCKVGFSWTSLFFGFFVPVVRGDVLWGILSLLLDISTGFIFWLIFPIIYNKIYIKNLLEKGYIPADDYSRNILIQKGWIANN